MEQVLANRAEELEESYLASRIEHNIRGLIYDVNVRTVDGTLIVHGYTSSSHLREVAMLTLVLVQTIAAGRSIDVRVERTRSNGTSTAEYATHVGHVPMGGPR